MRSKAIGALAVIMAATIAVWFAAPTGRAELRISDVTKRTEISTKAPWFPFRNGALVVSVDGSIDGTGILHIYSNRDRDYRTLQIQAGEVDEEFREAEAWVGDLRVVYEPGSASRGDLAIVLLCGRNER